MQEGGFLFVFVFVVLLFFVWFDLFQGEGVAEAGFVLLLIFMVNSASTDPMF